MPKVQRVVRYKVVKNGHTTLLKKKKQQHGKEHMENHIQCVIINKDDV